MKYSPSRVLEMTPGHAALLGLMDRYLAGLMDVSISPLEVHKLMYFLQAAGEPLRLRYVKAPAGPYAEDLRHVLRRAAEEHLISGFEDGRDALEFELTLVAEAVRDAEEFLKTQPATQDRFDRVAQLIEGFETPFGLELLAKVHWVIGQKEAQDQDSILCATCAWQPGGLQFTPIQIELATERLRAQGWLEMSALAEGEP